MPDLSHYVQRKELAHLSCFGLEPADNKGYACLLCHTAIIRGGQARERRGGRRQKLLAQLDYSG